VVVVCGDGGERERGRNETRREGGKQQQKKKKYLAFAAALAVHGLARLVGDTAGGQAVNANLGPGHCGGG
jgi:hypothetical protein